MAQLDKFYSRIQQKIDTTTNWNKATNFKPLEGEIIVYQDAGDTVPKVKIGHANTLVSDLPFITETIETDIDALEEDMAQAQEDIESLDARIDPIELKTSKTNIAYATCDTAAGTVAKVATIQNNTSWVLEKGSIITVLFTNTNSATKPTLNVNGTGAKEIRYQGSAIDSSSEKKYGGYKNTPVTYVYDGTYYRFAGYGMDSDTNTYLRVYRQIIEDGGTYDGDFPLLVSRTRATSIGTVDSNESATGVYGIISNTEEDMPTVNPHTGKVKVKSLEINGDTPVMQAAYNAKISSIEDSIAAKTLVQIITWEAND